MRLTLARRRSQTERLPFNLSNQDRWAERAERAVDLWRDYAPEGPLTIADVGAGNARVASLVARPGLTYIGYDLDPQHAAINQLDIRDGMPHVDVDVVFALGLIEYLQPDDPVIDRLARFSSTIVTSYVAIDTGRAPLAKRESLGWVRHETRAQTEDRFREAGLDLVADGSADDGETNLWLWRR